MFMILKVNIFYRVNHLPNPISTGPISWYNREREHKQEKRLDVSYVTLSGLLHQIFYPGNIYIEEGKRLVFPTYLERRENASSVT